MNQRGRAEVLLTYKLLLCPQDGKPLLVLTIEENQPEMSHALIAAGADVNASDKAGT